MLDDDASPPSSRDLANDDFLFHLYRGSELLQDNRVHEAKQELEQALGLQPRDAKGQDLLGIVYFRLGLYPRAIAIYERLVAAHPLSTTPRLNLALCYLKTGQAQAARSELERVLEHNPEHTRAWGYLGLAFQRLGDVERAVYAFRMGGHEGMARRLAELGVTGPEPEEPDPASRAAAARVFDELDRRGVEFSPDADSSAPATGSWAALEPGRETGPSPARAHGPRLSFAPSPARPGSLPPPGFTDLGPTLPPDPIGGAAYRPSPVPALHEATTGVRIEGWESTDAGGSVDAAPSAERRHESPDPSPLEVAVASSAGGSRLPDRAVAPWSKRPRSEAPSDAPSLGRRHVLSTEERLAPLHPMELGRALLLVWPKHESAGRTAAGPVLLRGGDKVAARLDALRSARLSTSASFAPLARKPKGEPGEGVVGGTSTPLVTLDGSTELVLGAPSAAVLVVLRLGPEPVYVRETALIALEGDVSWQSGRLGQGDAEPAFVLGLRGAGLAVVAVPATMQSLEVRPAGGLVARARGVLGWTAGVVVKTLTVGETPGHIRGMCALDGEGMVFVDGR
jgi:Flp pilus assembly protein TadD/uncharacterized protein (AIM24 family)